MRALDRYDPSREVTPAFVHRVLEWMERSGEVLVVLRYLRAAGRMDFALCATEAEFRSILERGPLGTDIQVFRDPQLPIRGAVDEALIAAAFAVVPEGAEYLLVTRETEPDSPVSRHHRIADTHRDLREDLQEFAGAEIACGLCPDYTAPDHEGMVSASKGGIDGPR